MNIIIAILIFGVIIAIHEFGHFIVAKSCDVRVNEFSIGMGPALFKKQKEETLYSVRLLPIGGYCSLEGEDSSSEDNRSFQNKKVWQRILILAAGAIMNVVLGFILLIVVSSIGDNFASTTVSSFYDNAKSQQTGLMVGDRITKINGMNIYIDGDISYQFMNDKDAVFDMVVERNGEKVHLENVAFDVVKNEKGQSLIIDFTVEPIEKTFFSVLDYSVKKTYYVGKIVLFSLSDILQGKYRLNDLSGPVRIVSAIGDVIVPTNTFRENLITVLNMAVFITINVGIFNLLPLPALDGGRIVFRIFEGITRKKIKPEVEGVIHFVGLALLIVLMIVVSYNDVIKLIK